MIVTNTSLTVPPSAFPAARTSPSASEVTSKRWSCARFAHSGDRAGSSMVAWRATARAAPHASAAAPLGSRAAWATPAATPATALRTSSAPAASGATRSVASAARSGSRGGAAPVRPPASGPRAAPGAGAACGTSGDGDASRNDADRRTAPTPSARTWWSLATSAPRPSSSPSTTVSSHRGWAVSKGAAARAAARSRTSRSAPGAGTRSARTWRATSKSGSSAHHGGTRPNAGATTRWRRTGSWPAAVTRRSRSRARSAGWSSSDTDTNVERSAGSSSSSHISASAPVSGAPGTGLPRDRRVFELVQLRPPLDGVEDALDGPAGVVAVVPGPVHHPDEHGGVADEEGRHAEDLVGIHGIGVRLAELGARPPRLDLLGHRGGVDAVAGEDAVDDLGQAEVEALVMARREQGAVHRQELLGEPVAHDHR